MAAPATILKEPLKGKGRPGMGCDGGDIEPKPLGTLEKLRAAAAVRSGRASPVWEGAAGTWPELSPHTASDCGRFQKQVGNGLRRARKQCACPCNGFLGHSPTLSEKLHAPSIFYNLTLRMNEAHVEVSGSEVL